MDLSEVIGLPESNPSRYQKVQVHGLSRHVKSEKAAGGHGPVYPPNVVLPGFGEVASIRRVVAVLLSLAGMCRLLIPPPKGSGETTPG